MGCPTAEKYSNGGNPVITVWAGQTAEYFLTRDVGLAGISHVSASRLNHKTTMCQWLCVSDKVATGGATALLLFSHHVPFLGCIGVIEENTFSSLIVLVVCPNAGVASRFYLLPWSHQSINIWSTFSSSASSTLSLWGHDSKIPALSVFLTMIQLH